MGNLQFRCYVLRLITDVSLICDWLLQKSIDSIFDRLSNQMSTDFLPTAQSEKMIKVDEVQVCLQTAEKYWRSQQWQATIAACAKALALDRGIAKAHKLMGDALQKTGKIEEATGYYKEAIALQPDFAEVYANLGTLYAQQKHWQQAIDYYQQALVIKPDFTAVYRHLSKCQLQQAEAQSDTATSASAGSR